MTSHIAVAISLLFDNSPRLAFTSWEALHIHMSQTNDFDVECKNSSKDHSAHHTYSVKELI